MLIKADPRPINFQFKDPIWFYYLALLLCVVSLLIAWRLTRSRFGARLVAIRENEDAARALGIDVFAEKVKVLTLSGAMCAAGGTFYAQKYLYIDPNIAFGVDKSVEMLLVSMVGGAGTIFGPLIGSVALTGINELTRWRGQRRAGAEERPAAQPDRLRRHADPDRGPPARRPDGPVPTKAAPCVRDVLFLARNSSSSPPQGERAGEGAAHVNSPSPNLSPCGGEEYEREEEDVRHA